MPALVLHHCKIPDPIHLKWAHILHLSLQDSRITHLDAEGLHVDSGINFKNLKSAENENAYTGVMGHGTCWVDLRAARVEGAIKAEGAEFCLPIDADEKKRDNRKPYALSLYEAKVDDCLLLRPNVKAYGGISISSAFIGGDVRAEGAQCYAIYGNAFHGQTVEIRGNLILRAWNEPKTGDVVPFKTEGNVWLICCHIHNQIELRGARICKQEKINL